MRAAMIAALGGIAIFADISALGGEREGETLFTTTEPIIVPGRILPGGTYVVKLTGSSSTRHSVQIFNEGQTRVQATVLAVPNYRAEPSEKTEFTYWETGGGQPRALRGWFFAGETRGQEFAYPKDVAARLSKANRNTPVPIDNRTEVAQDEPVFSPRPEPIDITGNEQIPDLPRIANAVRWLILIGGVVLILARSVSHGRRTA